MSATEEARFRLSVCLERFFSDERARCFISVSGAQPVRWLRRRLRRLFALPRRLALLSRGHLLPPDEPLSLLHPDDLVQVIPTTIDLGTGRNDRADIPIESTMTSTPKSPANNIRKRKRRASSMDVNTLQTIATTTPENVSVEDLHKKKKITIPPASTSIDCPELCLHSEAILLQQHHGNDRLINKDSKIDPLQEVKEHALALLDNYTEPPRRRRVRRRRPRRTPQSDSMSLQSPVLLPDLNLLHPPTRLPDSILPQSPSDTNLAGECYIVTGASESVTTESEPIISEKQASVAELTEKSANLPDMLNVLKQVSVSSLNSSGQDFLQPADSTPCTSTSTPALTWAQSACEPPRVLRNDAAAPRVPRIVRSLSNNAITM